MNYSVHIVSVGGLIENSEEKPFRRVALALGLTFIRGSNQ